jgi:hypothetical protein
MNPSGSVPAGDLVVVMLAITDPGGGNQFRLWKCDDSQGNHYALYACSATGAGDCVVFACKLNFAITGADTITAGMNGAIAGNGAKAMTAWQFTIGGRPYCASFTGTTQGGGSPWPSITLASAVPSVNYLWLHGLAYAGPSTDSITYTGGWTNLTQDGTTGGSDESIVGEFLIATATNETPQMTNNTESPAEEQVLLPIGEYTDTTAFPTTPILDNFNRANEHPLAGGWNTAAYNPAQGTLALVSNAATSETPETGFGGQIWGTTNTTGDQEAYGTMSAVADQDTYHAIIVADAVQGNICNRADWNRRRVNQPTDFIIMPVGAGDAFCIAVNQGAGDRYGVRVVSSIQSFWLDTGGGFLCWGALLNAPSGVGPPYAPGMLIYRDGGGGDQVVRIDDFGGGPFVSPLGHLLPILGVGS